MATLTGIIASSSGGGGGGGGIDIGQMANLAPINQYGSFADSVGINPVIAGKEYIRTGFLKKYNSDYSSLIANGIARHYCHIDANSNTMVSLQAAVNSNGTQLKLNWANNQIPIAQGYVQAGANGGLSGPILHLEKSNTDFILFGFTYRGGIGRGYLNDTNQTTPFNYKFGPNIANVATGNSNTWFSGPDENDNIGGKQYFRGNSGFMDSHTFKGRVMVVGGRKFLTNWFVDPTYNDIGWVTNYNAFVIATNTNSFSTVSQTALSIPGDDDTNYGDSPLRTAIASNGNNLIVVCSNRLAQTSGYIITSTDGLTWTNRTPSGAPNLSYLRRLTYSTTGNCFIYVISDGRVYTSTDGYTLTNRTLGLPLPYANGRTANVVSFNAGQSRLSAHSNSNTIILLNANTMLHTQNGVSYGIRSFNDTPNLTHFIGGYGGGNSTSIVYYNNNFIIMAPGIGGRTVYSDDDGVTWKLDFSRWNQNAINLRFQNAGSVRYSANGEAATDSNNFDYTGFADPINIDGKLYCINYGGSAGGFPIDISAQVAQTTPTFVGVPYISVTSQYLRIK